MLTPYILKVLLCVISDFRPRLNDILALLGCHASSVGSYWRLVTTYPSHVQGSRSPNMLDPWTWDGFGLVNLSRNVESTHVTFQKSEDLRCCYFLPFLPRSCLPALLLPDTHAVLLGCQVSTWKFTLGRADPESIYSLWSIVKIMLSESCRTYNCNRTWQLHLCTYRYNYTFRDSVTVSSLLVGLIFFIYFSKL